MMTHRTRSVIRVNPPPPHSANVPWATWPNAISALRLLLTVPFLILLVSGPEHRRTALAVFAFLAASDFLDGWLARRMGTSSRIGEMLDPAADKLLITGASILLAMPSVGVLRDDGERFVVPWMSVAPIFVKDFLVLIGFTIVRATGRTLRMPARWSGKASTAGQLMLVVLVLLYPEMPASARPTMIALCWASAAAAMIAAADYTWFGLKVLRGKS